MQTSRKTTSTIVQELRARLEHDHNLRNDFMAAFDKALKLASRDFEDYNIKTFSDYIDWYEYLLSWVPSEQRDGGSVLRVILLFYFVMNIDPLKSHTSPIEPSTKAPYTWLSDWVIRYAKEIGKFLDTPESLTPYTLDTFRNADHYNLDRYIVPPGGWKTFNEFFARELKPGVRKTDNPNSNLTIVSPADAKFENAYPVDGDGNCILAKGIPWPISELLNFSPQQGGVDYGETFAGGQFCHGFLAPHDYHRQHAPVTGTVIEARVIPGLCYLQVDVVPDGLGRLTVAPLRRHAAAPVSLPAAGEKTIYNPDEPGYQFISARGLVLIETADVGLVAVLPIGMAQVSSVVLTVKKGDVVKKGQEISYFQFGGSNVVVVFQKKADVKFEVQHMAELKAGETVIARPNPSM